MNPLKPEQKSITPIEECRAKGYRLTKTSRRSRESIDLKVCISWLLSKCIESLSTYHPIFSLFLRPLVPPPPLPNTTSMGFSRMESDSALQVDNDIVKSEFSTFISTMKLHCFMFKTKWDACPYILLCHFSSSLHCTVVICMLVPTNTHIHTHHIYSLIMKSSSSSQVTKDFPLNFVR